MKTHVRVCVNSARGERGRVGDGATEGRRDYNVHIPSKKASAAKGNIMQHHATPGGVCLSNSNSNSYIYGMFSYSYSYSHSDVLTLLYLRA